MKKIMIVWGFIAIVMVGGLTYLGLNIQSENKPYKNLEKELEKQAIALVGAKPNIINENNTITIEQFKENGYEINENINGDKCKGYVEIIQNMNIPSYKPYIKCQKYTTSGYKS